MFATRTTGFPEWRAIRAKALSAAVTPSRAVDDEQHEIGYRDGLLGLFAHAIGNRSLPRFLETGGVDQADFGIEQICDAFAPVARQTRQVGDERRARAGQPIEKRRFADVRTTDDRDDRKCEMDNVKGTAIEGLRIATEQRSR